MGKIKILNIVNHMGNGGIQTLLLTLSRNIDKSKYTFDYLVYNEDNTYYDEIIQAGGHVYVCPRGNNFLTTLLKRLQYKMKLYRQNGYDIVQVHSGTPRIQYSGIPEHIAKISNRVFYCHNIRREMSSLKLRWVSMCRFMMSLNFNHFIAVSEAAAEWGFTKKVVKRRLFSFIPNGIMTEQFLFNPEDRQSVRERLGILDKYVVGNICRFTDQKNIPFLINAFSKLKETVPDSVLLLIGGGELYDKVKEQIKQLSLEKDVILYGPSKQVAPLLSAMDVFVFPSIYEGLGIVAVEAQANGLHVIASSGVPIEAKVTDLMEFLPLSAPIDKWVDTIKKFTGRYTRVDTSRQIAANNFDVRSSVDKLQDLYETWCN